MADVLLYHMALNPGGTVPTLVHGDQTLPDSRLIIEYVDRAFDGPKLTPTANGSPNCYPSTMRRLPTSRSSAQTRCLRKRWHPMSESSRAGSTSWRLCSGGWSFSNSNRRRGDRLSGGISNDSRNGPATLAPTSGIMRKGAR
ncbi:MAG: glutathione S-transferase N-terminal domain-containing protein [Deltaproteobacteria bacterium]|nr:glutathione S-transferase N-terminal domain-containing protein [Deltaproteobacteria bacterium]